MTADQAAIDCAVTAHKRAHGLTPNSAEWDDPRWETEWAFDAEAMLDILVAGGHYVPKADVTAHIEGYLLAAEAAEAALAANERRTAATLDAAQEAITAAEARVTYLEEREAHWAKVLGVTDGGQYRNDWDSRIRAVVARVTELEHRLFPAQGEGYDNEVERQRAVIDELTHVAEVERARGDEAVAVIREIEQTTNERAVLLLARAFLETEGRDA